MNTKYSRCVGCDVLLYSIHAKELGLCPDCEPDSDESANIQALDLEEQFNAALSSLEVIGKGEKDGR